MDQTERFNQTLHAWTEVFFSRSMHSNLEYARSVGLTVPQFGALMRIHRAGACGVSAIGDYLGVTNAASSQLVDRLVAQGLLERTEDPRDRRGKQITLTPRALSLVQQFIDSHRAWMHQLASNLTPAEQETIISALATLIAAARRLDPTFADFPPLSGLFPHAAVENPTGIPAQAPAEAAAEASAEAAGA